MINAVLVNEDPQTNEPTQSGGGGGTTPSATTSGGGGGGGAETSTPAGEDTTPNPAGKLNVNWATMGLVSLGALMGGGLVAF